MALTDKLTAIGNAIRVQSGKTELIPLSQMPDEIINLQSLNFDVVGNPKPNNPKENTIWLNTDTPITSWVFSATEPSTVESGMVWFPVGTSSTVAFNALKKNGIQVYPLSAKQYVSGAWVAVTAESYQGGKWVDWITYLYNKGDQCTDITGGWSNVSTTAGTKVTFNTDRITIKQVATSGRGSATFPAKPYDFTGKNKLYIRYTETSTTNERVTVGISASRVYAAPSVASVKLSTANDNIIALDVSSISGKYYPCIYGNSESGCDIFEIYCG